MARPLRLDPDRLFSSDPVQRAIARMLYAEVSTLPILSPHGHTDPRWFASNEPWSDATALLLSPDHYLYRMLYSQGIALDRLGVSARAGVPNVSPRASWQILAEHYHLFRGTPSRLWLDHVFADVLAIDVQLESSTADHYFDVIGERLTMREFRPRALFDRFGIDFSPPPKVPTPICRTTTRSAGRAGPGAW